MQKSIYLLATAMAALNTSVEQITTSDKQLLVRMLQDEEAPVEEAPAEEAPVEEAPAEEAPAEETTEEAPAEGEGEAPAEGEEEAPAEGEEEAPAEGEGEAPAEGEEPPAEDEAPKKVSSFKPEEFQWTASNKQQKTLPEFFLSLKGKTAVHEVKPADAFSASQYEAISKSLDEFCQRISTKPDEFVYQQVIFSE